MKKLIVLIVVVVVIMGLLKIMGGKVYLSKDSEENIESNEWSLVNKVAMQGNRLEDVIGADLPTSAHDGHFEILLDNFNTKSYWIIAKLPKEDFDRLMDKLELTKEPDLLTIWPEVFDCEKGKDIESFWDITKSVDGNTYYGEDPQIETRIMLKYEEGSIYVKRSTYYDKKIGPDDLVYLKVRRR